MMMHSVLMSLVFLLFNMLCTAVCFQLTHILFILSKVYKHFLSNSSFNFLSHKGHDREYQHKLSSFLLPKIFAHQQYDLWKCRSDSKFKNTPTLHRHTDKFCKCLKKANFKMKAAINSINFLVCCLLKVRKLVVKFKYGVGI